MARRQPPDGRRWWEGDEGKPSIFGYRPQVVLMVALVVLAVGGSLGYLLTSVFRPHPTTYTTVYLPPTATPTATATATPTPLPTATPTPTHVPQWTTVQTFTGNGNKKTTTFVVSDSEWRLAWSCDPPSAYFGSYNVIVDVKYSDGSDADYAAINTICKAGNTGDSTQEYVSGDFYLDVTAGGAWTIQVQALQ